MGHRFRGDLGDRGVERRIRLQIELGSGARGALRSSGVLDGAARRVRIFSRTTLRDFWAKLSDAAGPLQAWFEEVETADWKGPQDIRQRFGSADFLQGNRVVFDIGGNKYRLIVHVAYKYHAVYIRFVGTHAEYDKIDANEV